jgi:predicted ATPase
MITRLKIRNFKSLKELDLELGPVNVLVGPNMAGKSNTIDALKFVFDVLHPSAGQQGFGFALNNRGGGADLPWKGSSEGAFSIRLDGTLEWELGTNWSYEIGVSLQPQGFVQIQREDLRLRRGEEERELISYRQGVVWLKNFDGKELGGVPGQFQSVLESRAANWDGDFLRQLIDRWRFHHFIPALMKGVIPTGSGQVLEPVGNNISAWLMWMQTQYKEQFDKVNQAACDLLPGFRRLMTSPTVQGAVFLSSEEVGLQRSIPVWQMSDGELALLALLSVIYSPPELSGVLYCIEEPENHLYPKVLGALIKLLRQVRQEAADAGFPLSQIVIATQSPQLVDLFSLDEVIWLEKRNGATVATRPSSRKHLRSLVTDKELGLADIVYSGILSEPE